MYLADHEIMLLKYVNYTTIYKLSDEIFHEPVKV